jgi:hypothetical protein
MSASSVVTTGLISQKLQKYRPDMRYVKVLFAHKYVYVQNLGTTNYNFYSKILLYQLKALIILFAQTNLSFANIGTNNS